jgi:hypothetical protein
VTLHFQMTEVASPVPFGYVQLRCVRREAHDGFLVESDDIDDERISVPASDSVSLPRRVQVRWVRAPVEKNLSEGQRIVFVEDHRAVSASARTCERTDPFA